LFVLHLYAPYLFETLLTYCKSKIPRTSANTTTNTKPATHHPSPTQGTPIYNPSLLCIDKVRLIDDLLHSRLCALFYTYGTLFKSYLSEPLKLVHLTLFYFYGRYYHISHRLANISHVRYSFQKKTERFPYKDLKAL
jgi:hypothetical protein